MSHQGDNTWTEQHTASLNGLLRLAAAKLHLAVADWDQELELAVDLEEGDTVGGVVLSQGAGKSKRLVALVGRDLTAGELSWTYPEQLLALSCWGMRRLYRWVGFVPKVTVAIKEEACLLLVRDKNVHARLKAHVLKLGMYGVTYKL